MDNQPENTIKSPHIIAGRYQLDEMVGEGSYSIVFKGIDIERNRHVAIKELRAEGMSKEEAHEAQELFFNEINILKSLDHFALPRVYDFFYHEGKHFMVMEWIEGKNLLEIFEKGGKLSEKKALEYMKQLADILIYLQDDERKVIYKDIKPSNIIVDKDGDIRLIDFGISRFYSPSKKKDTHILGTPGYAPPEAYTETQTDFSADIYSLGATFYHLTTGEDPFQFKFRFPSPRKYNLTLSGRFSNLLQDMLKDRKTRIQDAQILKKRIGKPIEFSNPFTKSIYELNILQVIIFFAIFTVFTLPILKNPESSDTCCCGVWFFGLMVVASLLFLKFSKWLQDITKR